MVVSAGYDLMFPLFDGSGLFSSYAVEEVMQNEQYYGVIGE